MRMTKYLLPYLLAAVLALSGAWAAMFRAEHPILSAIVIGALGALASEGVMHLAKAFRGRRC